ncbi:unnamed protein product [Closterium sp. NIES-53]
MAPDSKGWLMWDPKSKRTLVSRDVKFVEDVMYKDWQQQQQMQIGLRLQEIERSAVEEVQLHLEDLPGSELTSDHSGGGEQQVSARACCNRQGHQEECAERSFTTWAADCNPQEKSGSSALKAEV